MRLICPNCSAQYEVDDSAIPAAGRDVQCSDCGTAWFQKSAADVAVEAAARRAAVAAAAAAASSSMEWDETARLAENPPLTAAQTPAPVSPPPLAAPAPAMPSGPSAPAPEPAVVASDDAEPAKAPDPAPDPAMPETPSRPEAEPADESPAQPPVDESADAEEETAPPAPPEGLRRRALDDTTLNVLREEAEREARARIEEGASILIEPAPVPPAPVVVERVLDTRAAPGPDPDDRQGRKELLPDIEQINSTLRATAERAGDAVSRDAPEMLRRQRAGFRFGFVLSATTIAVLVVLYAMAPMIVTLAPGTKTSMINYVAAIDGLRTWFEGLMMSATQAMESTGG